jgi:hypothetical protein
LLVADQVSHETACSFECIEFPNHNSLEYPRIWYRDRSEASAKCGRRADVDGTSASAGEDWQAVIYLVYDFKRRRPKQALERPALARAREATEQGRYSTTTLRRFADSGK